MWLVFVEACSLLCSRVLSKNAINRADMLIHHYCCLFEAEFGKEYCYPNLHMHCHLKQCLLDYGPASSFWLFAFERMNGVLGSFHTNNKAVEVQHFRKFISKQQVGNIEWPDTQVTQDLKPVIDELRATKENAYLGALFDHIVKPFEPSTIFNANNYGKLLPPIKEKGFIAMDISIINEYFNKYIGPEFIQTLILHKQSKCMVFNGDLYGTFFSRQQNSSLVIVRYKDENNVIQECSCFIVGFVECTVVFRSMPVSKFILAKVVPLQEHPQKDFYAKPVLIFQKPDTHFLSNSHGYFYVFLSSILCRCAYTVFKHDSSAVAVVPCNSYCGI